MPSETAVVSRLRMYISIRSWYFLIVFKNLSKGFKPDWLTNSSQSLRPLQNWTTDFLSSIRWKYSMRNIPLWMFWFSCLSISFWKSFLVSLAFSNSALRASSNALLRSWVCVEPVYSDLCVGTELCCSSDVPIVTSTAINLILWRSSSGIWWNLCFRTTWI
jgi:hypothetical protein